MSYEGELNHDQSVPESMLRPIAALPPVRVQAVVRLSECDLEEARRVAMSTLQTEEERNGAAFMYGALLKKFVKSAPDAWACECGTDNDWCDKVCVACGSDRPNNMLSVSGERGEPK